MIGEEPDGGSKFGGGFMLKRGEWLRIGAKFYTTHFWTTHDPGDTMSGIAARTSKVVARSLSPFGQNAFHMPTS